MKILAFFLAALYLGSCSSTKNSEESASAGNEVQVADREHNSRNALDWAGIYRGTLPYADGSGIKMQLQLNPDMTFERSLLYQGKEASVIRQKGKFTWDETGSTVTLDISDDSKATNTYKVGENMLWQLDENGRKITGPLAEKYILIKAGSDNAITGKYWKLIELNGREIAPAGEQKREPHFILQTENKQVSGNGGCNTFTGTYILPEGNKIGFSPLAATRMACPNLSAEYELFQAFAATDNYTLTADTLSLNNAKMAPLARFVWDYLR